MALTYLPMLLQQDVNKLYPDILNYEVIPPPHWNGRVNHTFFLKRRGGIVQDVDFGGDKLLDYLELGTNKYGLIKDGTAIKVMKNNSTTNLFTGIYSTAVNHRLLLMSGCSGALLTSGSSATASVNVGVYKITDSSKSWVVNEFAGKYVYLQTATTGQGQAFRIASNTATELVLERGREVLPSGITYKVFEDFSEVPAVISDDGLYLIHNDGDIYKAENFGTVVDVIYNMGRTMAVDSNDNVIVSYQGYNSLFLDQTSIIGTYSGVKSMVQFQDFVLMLTNTRIGMIKKETVTVVSTESIEVFKPVTITNLLGTFSAKSFSVYNQGLYLFTSARRFVAITITPSGTDRYIVSQEDQGAYIQQFLDSVADTNDIAVAINAEKIVIIDSSATKHNMYLYDTYYKFRHRWDTELPIYGAVVFNDIYFLGDRLYTYNKTYDIDYGNNDYVPYIRVIFGESDIFSLKNILMNKIYIGKNTDPSTQIRWKCHLDGGIYTLQTTFAKLKYLLESSAYGGDGMLGTNILGFGIFGGYGISVSDYVVSAINTIEIPTNFTCTLMEIEMTGDLEFGGMMLGYEVMDPVITPVNSVLGL